MDQGQRQYICTTFFSSTFLITPSTSLLQSGTSKLNWPKDDRISMLCISLGFSSMALALPFFPFFLPVKCPDLLTSMIRLLKKPKIKFPYGYIAEQSTEQRREKGMQTFFFLNEAAIRTVEIIFFPPLVHSQIFSSKYVLVVLRCVGISLIVHSILL